MWSEAALMAQNRKELKRFANKKCNRILNSLPFYHSNDRKEYKINLFKRNEQSHEI